MVDVSYVEVFAVVISFLVLFVVIIKLIRTTRKVVDNTNILLKSQPQYGTFAVYLTEKRLAKACLMLKSHQKQSAWTPDSARAGLFRQYSKPAWA